MSGFQTVEKPQFCIRQNWGFERIVAKSKRLTIGALSPSRNRTIINTLPKQTAGLRITEPRWSYLNLLAALLWQFVRPV